MFSFVPAYLSRPTRTALVAAAALLGASTLALAQDAAAKRSANAALVMSSAAAHLGVFGAMELAVGRPEDIRQWDDFKRRYEGEKKVLDRCVEDAESCPSPRARTWSIFLAGQQGKKRDDQVESVNRYINAIAKHDSDANVFGLRDYWAAPLEFLERTGDCEDFTILKFVSLLYLGVPNEDMRIVIALDRTRNIGHAVLAVRNGVDEDILDTSYAGIWASTLIADYAPEYSLNLTTRWAHIPVDDAKRAAQILAQSQQTTN